MSTVISPEAVAAAVRDALDAIAAAATVDELKQARAAHVGENSPLGQLNAGMRDVAPELKAETGKLMGQARGQVNEAYAAQESTLAAAEETARLMAEAVDVTAVAQRRVVGARHPLNLLMEEMSNIFVGMGWEVAEGPELENEWFNFDALNFDQDHPARAMQDTFFVEPVERHLLMRTHTSPVQVRSLLSRQLPVYVVAPGRVYRTDELDATHTPVFHQMEGIAIDKGLTMAHLKGTLEHLARAMFGEGARIRLRPNYFPFTEPSAEVDVMGKNGKWLEVLGCGMVHPEVFKHVNIDSEKYRGFAFGLGVERLTMLRYGVNDLRLFFDGDIRFLSQFQ